jgi:hypothetical protein
MAKKKTFIDSPEWRSIVDNVQGIMTSDGTMSTLLDFERVLDEADVYAFKNWELGELVDGPKVTRYEVTCTFMWPQKLMPDPRAGKRLITLGCDIKLKKTSVKMPVKVESEDDFNPGTKYPKLVDRPIWLVNITIPKDLMNDIREGSVDIADQSIDLEDLDDAYAKDYDEADTNEDTGGQAGGMGGMGDMGAPPAPGGMPPPAPPGGPM